MAEDPELSTSSAQELAELERVLASPEFRASKRGQKVLRYVVERAVAGDLDQLKERSIGFELFERDPDYDTARDSIVRVAANDVRRRLTEYYAREYPPPAIPGIRIVLPPGSYVPEFRKTGIEPEALPETDRRAATGGEAPARPAGFRFRWKLATLLLTVALSSGGLVLWLRPATAGHGRSATPHPTVDLLWDQMFAGGNPACLVLSDSNFTVFQDMLGRYVTLQEYSQKRFSTIAKREMKIEEQQAFSDVLMRSPFTSSADAKAAHALGELNGTRHIPTDVVFARDFGTQYFDSHNVILFGSRRANPWIGLFESQLNFPSGFTENPTIAHFDNKAPRPGELSRYACIWEKRGYCQVAFLPNLRRNGNVLILSGTGMSTTLAGSDFITSEAWVSKFRSLLGPAARDRFPYFEVLLRVDLVATIALKFEIVAWRAYN